MATIHTPNGLAVKDCYATTNNSASSYEQPVWADADGNAYIQVGLPAAGYSISHNTEEQRITLGEEIRDRRKRLGLTIESLAKASGVAVANISKLERGGTANIDTLAKIASAMGCSITLG